MTDKQVNLHPKNASSVNLKPNIITENIPDKAVTLEKLDQDLQETLKSHTADIESNTADIESNTVDIETNMRDIQTITHEIESLTSSIATNTASIATNRADINTNTAEIESLKASVNTGTFDPTSDFPASQKSIMDAIMKADILARISKAMRDANKYTSVAYVFSYMTCSNLDFSFIDEAFLYFESSTPRNLDAHFMFGLCRKIVEIPYNVFLDRCFFEHISNGLEMFGECESLVTIGAYDFASITNLSVAFNNCRKLKHIHIKNFAVSFDISISTQFEEADLVEILNNLMDLTGKTSQTLTMGATNLAKLTDSDKAIATNKNWVLA